MSDIIRKKLFKYRVKIFALTILYIVIIAISFLIKQDLLLCFIIAFCLAIFLKLLASIVTNNDIASILYEDLNATMYSEIIHSKNFNPSPAMQINSALYFGDYQTLINICSREIYSYKSKRRKLIYINIIAHAYYEMGNYEKLKLTCDYFESCFEHIRNNDKIKHYFLGIQYYRLLINGQYDACKELIENSKSIRNIKNNTKITKIERAYNLAIIAYLSKDFEVALQLFNYIVGNAPNLNYAVLSKKYIRAITDHSFEFNYPDVLPDPSYKIPFENIRQRRSIISKVFIIIWLLLFVFSQVINQSQFVYNFEVKNRVNELYNEYNYINTMKIENNDKTYSICIVSNTDETFDLWFSVKTSNKDQIQLLGGYNTSKLGNSFSLITPDEKYVISFMIYKNEKDIPNNIHNKIKLNNGQNSVWITVTDIYEN